MNELDLERTQLNYLPRLHPVQLNLVDHVVLVQAALDKREGERRPVNGHVDFGEQKRNPADVILVTVGQDETPNKLLIFFEIGEIRGDDIDAQKFRVGEHHSRVEN